MTPKPDPQISEPSAGYARAVEQSAKTSADPSVAASFKEFAELDEEAAEMEIAPLNPAVKQTAKRILAALVQEFPRYYMVFPDEEGEIAIQASAGMGKGRGVLIVCDESGAACFVTMNGNSRHARYDRESTKDLPDDFIRAAMRELS